MIDMLALIGLCIYIFVKRHEAYQEATLKKAIFILSMGGILLLIAMFSVSFDQGTLHFAYSTDFILYQNNGEMFFRYCRSFGYVFEFLGVSTILAVFVKRAKGKKDIKNV
jgi:hypothetical protein